MRIDGLLLAAGSGSRMGRPKALMRDPDGTSWLLRSVAALHDGGCSDVLVVLGAGADEAKGLLDVPFVVAEDWAEGMGASLRCGLAALPPACDAALVSLVDLPDVGPDVVRRVLAAQGDLARASYDGKPGHPVLIGRSHWSAIAAQATGDRGARDYLAAADAQLVDCSDLATGDDVDTLA